MTAVISEGDLKKALNGLPLLSVHFFEQTDSTNERALRLAANQAAEYTLVFAEKQSAGRGRLGRKWLSSAGSSLTFSLILIPSEKEREQLSMFSFLGALAVCRAIQTVSSLDAQVKWPNDVLLNRKKTAGVLAETCWQGQRLSALVLGIGINLLPESVPPDDQAMFPATCIQTFCPLPLQRLAFLHTVIAALIDLRKTILEPVFMEDYRRHLAFLGERVFLKSQDEEGISGKLAGVDDQGQLLVEDADGRQTRIPCGDLHLRPLDK